MMGVQIGAKPPADFRQPIEMMIDCHRRIEHFLGVLKRVLAQFGERPLTDEARRALETSLTYFTNSAPKHTADEEESLFPRLRSSASTEAREAAATLERLESDHRQAEADHALVDRLAHDWLREGAIDAARRAELQRALDELASMYARHIPIEEEHVFVQAKAALQSDQLVEIGEEMRKRRSVLHAGPTGGAPASPPLAPRSEP